MYKVSKILTYLILKTAVKLRDKRIAGSQLQRLLLSTQEMLLEVILRFFMAFNAQSFSGPPSNDHVARITVPNPTSPKLFTNWKSCSDTLWL